MGIITSCEFKKSQSYLDDIWITNGDDLITGQKKFICSEYTHSNKDDIGSDDNWTDPVFFDVDDSTKNTRLLTHVKGYYDDILPSNIEEISTPGVYKTIFKQDGTWSPLISCPMPDNQCTTALNGTYTVMFKDGEWGPLTANGTFVVHNITTSETTTANGVFRLDAKAADDYTIEFKSMIDQDHTILFQVNGQDYSEQTKTPYLINGHIDTTPTPWPLPGDGQVRIQVKEYDAYDNIVNTQVLVLDITMITVEGFRMPKRIFKRPFKHIKWV